MTGSVRNGPESGGHRFRPLLRQMIGDVLRRTRLEQERTLSDVARDANVSMPYLSEIERGLKEASSEVLAAICDALDIGLADLLAEVGRELAADRARSGQVFRVIRLNAGFSGPALPETSGPAGISGPGEVTCLLAA